MKKIFLIFILALTLTGHSQTFSLGLHVYLTNGTVSLSSNVGGTVYTLTDSNTNGGQHYPPNLIVKGSSFTFNLSAINAGCSENLTFTKSLSQMLGDEFQLGACKVGFGGYATNFYPIYFRPVETITITNKNSTSELCAGEQLVLEASNTNTYPNEVYHWQYSIDNEATWVDLQSFINNRPSNAFTIQQMLGSSHVYYYNKKIYFRLGYSQKRALAESVSITYSPCAPLITNIQSLQPNCSGDPMTVIVTFDRPLDPTKNEILKDFQIIKTDGQLTGNQIPEIRLFDISNPSQYTYNNVVGLENGKRYSVKYQAFQGTKERGIPQTQKDFLYSEPEKFNFSATATPPECNGDDGAIEILAWGGSGTYKYQLDNGTATVFKNPETITVGTIAKQKIVIAASSAPNPNIVTNHTIKVTDDKGCIDTTKDE